MPGEAESEERKAVLEQIKVHLITKLASVGQATGTDLESQVSRVQQWKQNFLRKSPGQYVPLDLRVDSMNNTLESTEDPLPPVPVIKYTIDYFDDSKGENKEYAVALYDFEGEVDDDLQFR
jgi:hypothetical protein